MSQEIIPLVDLKAQYDLIRDEIDVAMAEILRTTRFIGGPPVHTFEKNFAAFCGAPDAVGVGNGTDAITIVLQALGVGPGDEVLVPASTFVATAEGVSMAGAVPVFTDVDPETAIMRVADMEPRMTARTRAVIPVHLYGMPAAMDEIMSFASSRNLLVVEDCAQAHGAKWKETTVGIFGDAATFSFYPGKNLGAYGDGGAVVSRSSDVLERCRLIRDHGRTSKYLHEIRGRNSRLDSLQASVLDVKLKHLETWNRKRRQLAAGYDALLQNIPQVHAVKATTHATAVYHLYVVLVPEREQVLAALNEAGVQAQVHYPVPLHQQPAYADGELALPAAEKLAHHVLSLPLYPELSEAQQERVADALRRAVQS